MAEVRLTLEAMRFIAMFERDTGAKVRDCIDEPDRLTFVVPAADLGKAIGHGAENIERLRKALKREVEVVGFHEDAAEFLKAIFHKFGVTEVTFPTRQDGRKVARVKVGPKEKGQAIGKGGRNVQLASALMARHTDVAEVVVD